MQLMYVSWITNQQSVYSSQTNYICFTGIYSLLLEHTASTASRASLKSSSENFVNLRDRRRCRVYGKPDAEVGSPKSP